jgi:hypothetical protein
LPWIAGIGCGLLVLGGVAVGAIFMLLPGRSSNAADSGGAIEQPESQVLTDPPLLAPDNPTQAAFNKRSFDVDEFVTRAFALAREHHADADLVAIDVMGTNPTGIVDLTASSSNMVNYRFRSESHSKAPPDFPENAEFESNCMVYVTVMQSGITSHVIDRWDCKAKIVGRPKCSLKRVWQKAVERGAPAGNVIGTFLYNADDDNGSARWIVSVPPSFSVILPDKC